MRHGRLVIVFAFILGTAGCSSCQILQQVAQNLPAAETPTLLRGEGSGSADAPVQWTDWVTAATGPLDIGALQAAAECQANFDVPTHRHVVINLMKRSLTDVQVVAGGVRLRQPDSGAQELSLTNQGLGFFYLDKEFGALGEVDDMYDDERVAIVLPAEADTTRPLTIEIRGVSLNASYSGSQHLSDPLVVTLAPCPNAPAADFTLSVGMIPNLTPGAERTFDVSVVRNAAMQSDVTLTATIAPSGVSVAFDPAVVPVASSASTGTVSAANDATPRTYAVTVTANGGGITRSATRDVHVVASDPAAPREGVDCECSSTGDYVAPVEPVQGAESPDGTFTLTVTPGSTGASLLLRHMTDNSCVIGVGTVAATAEWGFSPHGKYFLVAELRGTSTLRIMFHELTCNSTLPKLFERSIFVAPADEWDVAGWGFGPGADDRTFVVAAQTGQTTSELVLMNLATLFSGQSNAWRTVETFNNQDAVFRFSPCGDVMAVKKTVNNNLAFPFSRTRDFGYVGESSVALNSTNLDGDPIVAAAGHKIRVRRSSGSDIEQPVAPNESALACTP